MKIERSIQKLCTFKIIKTKLDDETLFLDTFLCYFHTAAIFVGYRLMCRLVIFFLINEFCTRIMMQLLTQYIVHHIVHNILSRTILYYKFLGNFWYAVYMQYLYNVIVLQNGIKLFSFSKRSAHVSITLFTS